MPLTVTAQIPERLTVTALADWLAQIGVDIHDVVEMHLRLGAAEFVIRSRDDTGHLFLNGGEAATHTLTIPIVDE